MVALRILHAHSTFDLGGKEARTVQLANAFGPAARHTLLLGVRGVAGALSALDPGVDFTLAPPDAPPLLGRPSWARWRALARYMAGFDLVLTYSWGAMDLAMAHRLHAKAMRLPPLIHHEDGFNEDEALRLKPQRNLFRRVALGSARAVAVPSRVLEGVARHRWGIAPARLHRIDNGVDLAACTAPPDAAAWPGGLPRGEDEVIVGTVAGLRPVKNLPLLVRAVASAGPSLRLGIAGEGPDRARVEAEAARCGLGQRLSAPGFVRAPARVLGLFDIFALSSDSEQAPIALAEAMAAGLPVAATDVGDVAAMVGEGNRRFIVPRGDEAGLARALAELAADPQLRARLGKENAAKASRDFDERVMFARYAALYGLADAPTD